MPLCPSSVLVAAARGCGFHNECGVIWFSLLLPANHSIDETHCLTQLFLTRAASQISFYHRESLYRVQDQLSIVCMARCFKKITYKKTKDYYLVNCIVRVQSALLLLGSEKDEVLHAISRRLFYVPPGLLSQSKQWMIRKGKYLQYQFVTTGFMISEFVCLKLALTTMSYEASHTKIPAYLPFLRTSILFLRPSKRIVTAYVYVRTVNHSSIVTQPVFLRSMLKEYCPEEHWPVLSRGICYLVGVREDSVFDVEQWAFHVHCDYSGIDADCEEECTHCVMSQPLSLFQISQLAYIRYLFLRRRARVARDHKCKFY
ncbi:ORF20 [Aviadenovirus phalacrocoracidae]|uniref:ORF20 n=1 Tax=Aviadenovirus sp. TaxID=2217649 RepID=A0ABZ0T460_9ADEN|nr:ORF20 [Aviadenovirus sp.]